MKPSERVCRAEYKPNCYILTSYQKRDLKDTLGEFKVKSMTSFLFDAGEYAAEWEPEYGPIQVWQKCDEQHDDAKEHYFYDFVIDTPLNWSQLAVDENQLPEAAYNGEFDYIFSVLQRWARR